MVKTNLVLEIIAKKPKWWSKWEPNNVHVARCADSMCCAISNADRYADDGDRGVRVQDYVGRKSVRSWARWLPLVVFLTLMLVGCSIDQNQTPKESGETVPVVTIAAFASAVQVGELHFTVTAVPAPATDLEVTVQVTVSGGDTAADSFERTATIAAGAASATLTLQADEVGSGEGRTVTARLIGGTGYTVGAGSDSAATVAVADDDAPPTARGPAVTIAAVTTSPVTEGTAVAFTVTATPAPAAPLTVNVSWSESGAMLAGSPPTTVILTTGSYALTAATIDDAADEPDSVVTAMIDAGTGYTVGTLDSATVTVEDDDDPPPGSAPEVTITAGTSPVTEGMPVVFTVTASPAPTASIEVNVSWSETGTMLPATSSMVLTISTGSDTFTIATLDDTADEPDSVVTAMIDAGTGYTPGTPRSATVTVQDNDVLPTVSITSASPSPVNEGEDITLTLGINPTVSQSIEGTVIVHDNSGGITQTLPFTFTAYASTTTFTHTVPRDGIIPPMGRSVVVIVSNDADYETDGVQFTFEITNIDVPPP